MRRVPWTVFVSGMLAINLGCAANSVMGDAAHKTGRFTGNVGVTGNSSHLTIESGSVVPKLSVIGDDCSVTVEDGAELGRVEFWGNGSNVSIPGDAVVWVSQVGTNKVERRSAK